MIIQTRRKRILQTLALYIGALGLISYFAFHTYHGDHGIKAKNKQREHIATLSKELSELQKERQALEHRLSLMQSDNLDPDMLDERARRVLNYAGPKDIVIMLKN